jgi:predicted transcriptional regulator
MSKLDFFHARQKERLFKIAFKKCGMNYNKVGKEIEVLIESQPLSPDKKKKKIKITSSGLNLSSDEEEEDDGLRTDAMEKVYVCHRCY